MRRRLALLTLAAAVLTGCGAAPAQPEPASSTPEASVSAALPEEEQYDLSGLPELPGAEALEGLTPADFGCMEEAYKTLCSQYTLLEGTELENTVTLLEGEENGPTLYIIGGIHGDELAGWYAGTILKSATVKAGKIYLVAPANRYGAEHNQRKTQSDRDLNRNFPGDPEGWDAQRIADALYQDIEDKNPVLLLDLHEARRHTDGRDNLGNSLICQDIQPISDLIFSLLEEYEDQPLDLFGSPPVGSVNRAVTENLAIPVITIETDREQPLPLRVRTQLQLVESVMEWYGLR